MSSADGGFAPAGGDEEISLAELIVAVKAGARVLWAERRLVSRITIAALALGFFIALGSTSEYTAQTKLLPYRAAGPSGSLSGLAGLAGVRLPNGAIDQIITADLYPEVAKSLDFRVAVAETPIRFSSLPAPMSPRQYFEEGRDASVVSTVSKYTIGLPRLILGALRPAPAPIVLPSGADDAAIASYDVEFMSVVQSLSKRLVVTADKKTGVITMTGRMPDRYASADLVREASELLMARIIDYEARKASEQLQFLEDQFSRARARLDRVERERALFQDRTRGTVSATAQLESQRLARELTIASDVYRQMSSELEQARIKKNQDTPVFTVLEQVVVPSKRTSPRRSLLVVGSLVLGVMLGAGTVGARRFLAQLPG